MTPDRCFHAGGSDDRPDERAVSPRRDPECLCAKDGRAEDREIKLLRRSGRFAAVAAGLMPGERVIVYPSDRIASGVRVEPR